MLKLFLFLSILVTCGCEKLSFSIANAPVFYTEKQIKRDIVYSLESSATMDIYYPDEYSKPLPVILFIYGGNWQRGDKDSYAFVASNFTQRGFAVAIADYRKYPEVKFPAFVQDMADATVYLHRYATDLNLDQNRLFILGHSAGAHIGALVATDPFYMKNAGGNRDWIKAFAGLAGPYAFIPEEKDLQDIFGPPERYDLMQVPTFIDGKQPKMLLLQGREDKVVGLFNLEKLEKAIRQKGGVVQTKIYPGLDHVGIVGALSWVYRNKANVADEVTEFFDDKNR
jgi:acetyl esterase/lipase